MSRKKSSSSNIPAVDGRHNMTSLELSEADDLATLMTVDSVLGFTTHKMDKNFNPVYYDKKLREKWKDIMKDFITEPNYESTYHQLVSTEKIKPHWKKDERFKRHIFRFLYLFDKRSGIEVRPCHRYENEGKLGAAIFATREWERGSQITTLFGCISEVRQSEEELFHETKNEFSVMYSTRKNCSQLWLGPAAYVNHDCKPNCRFTEANYDSKMTLETLRDIHPNDELLIYYGNNFFGIDNIECECFTCELRGRGVFSYNNYTNSYNNSFICNKNFHAPNGALGCPISNNIDLCSFSHSSINHKQNDEYRSDPARRVVTRSSKITNSSSDNRIGTDPSKLIPSTHSIQGALNGLKKSDSAYCLRITYSRIDRVKQNILSRVSNNTNNNNGNNNHLNHNKSQLNFRNHKSPNISIKRNVKRKGQLLISTDRKHFKEPLTINKPPDKIIDSSKTVKVDSQIIKRRSLRQSNSKTLSSKPVNNTESHINLEENRLGKLTIKLRKTSDHPNQYEHCETGDSISPIQKLTIHKKTKLKHTNGNNASNLRDSDSNIFSRMTQLYLTRSENITPPPPVLQSDTPPFLSPWFCSEKSSSHSSRKSSKTMKLKLKPYKKSNHLLKIVNLNTKPTIEKYSETNHFDCFPPHVPDTASSDIPSYSASSPTIPILEIESETELVPPQLICELQDQDDFLDDPDKPPSQHQFLSNDSSSQSVVAKNKVKSNLRSLRKSRRIKRKTHK